VSNRGGVEPADDDAGVSLWGRIRYGRDGAPLRDRLRDAMLKPAPPGEASQPVPASQTLEQLQAAERYADDKERFLGLIAAPLAAAIGFLIANYLVDHDPPALKNGVANPLHQNVTTYHTLELALLVLAFVMLATAWYRKRLFLGMAMALYGLGVFNLHYWGFGVPFLLAGAWLLVRSYRAHQAVRTASGEGGGRGGGASGYSRPRANKRYTPPI
jgi:hypothetical protein